MRRAALLFVVIWLAAGIVGEAKGDGTIILRNAPGFQTGIDNNNISSYDAGQTVDPQQTASNTALSTAFPSDNRVPSVTGVSTDLNGLLSYAPSAGRGGQNVSSWTYGYHIDPDLTDYTVNLRLYIPQVGVYQNSSSSTSGINMISIALTSVGMDSNNQPVYSTRAWGFDNNLTPGILNPDPSTHLEDFTLAAVDGAGAGGSNFFAQDSGFDIRNVWYVSVGYRGTVDSTFPPTPVGGNYMWIGTESLVVTAAVTPEPNSAVVLACGVLGVGFLMASLRRRARRRTRTGLSA